MSQHSSISQRQRQINQRKKLAGWALFDVANSAYTTIIITVAYSVVYATMIVPHDESSTYGYQNGNLLWAIVVGLSNFMSAIFAPLIGALSDQSRRLKYFLFATVVTCSVSSILLFFAQPGGILLASLLIIISNVGFNFSENIISSFLPHITTRENMGKVSAFAWGLGYFGGLLSIFVVYYFTGLDYRMQNWDHLRLIGPITGIFFAIFSVFTFLWVPNPPRTVSIQQKTFTMIKNAYGELKNTFKNLKTYHNLAVFLLAFFFFQGGLAIVISFSALYGSQVINLVGKWQMIFFVSLQISAALGAWTFGLLQHKIGPIVTLKITLLIWILVILGIYFLKPLMSYFPSVDIRVAFIIIGNIAGLCLGATQALARGIIGLLSPAHLSGEMFGFWGLAGKLAAVFATLSFGIMQSLLSIELALLLCSAFFIIGFILCNFVNIRVQA